MLPATTWYEKLDLTATPLHPFLQLQQPAIDPSASPAPSSTSGRSWSAASTRRSTPSSGEVDAEDAIRIMLAEGRPDRGHHATRCCKAGPGAAPRRRPRHPVPRPDPRPRAVPAGVAAGGARQDRAVRADRPHRVLQGGGPVPRPSARRCRPTSRPSTTTSNPPTEFPLRAAHARTRSGGSTRSYGNNPWMEEIHGGRPQVLIHPRGRARVASRRATRSRCSTPGARWSPGRTSPTAAQAGLGHPARGLVAAPVQGRQGRQRADLVGRQPDPRGPLRGRTCGHRPPAGRTAAAR